jgi:serine protease Do
MRIAALLPTVYAASLVASAAHAQRPSVITMRPDGADMARMRTFSADEPRAVIGVTTTGGSTNRDTLGVLVASVRSGSPAEKAGLEEGDRIASVNGVSLKLAPADVGDYEMSSAMSRRLTRELDKLKPGDDVELRVVANGQTKSIKVKTISPEALYETPNRPRDSERASLGFSLATTGTSRDSLGVFVMGVDDNSPAAKAGVEEGSRIASINGVDVRPKRIADDEDSFIHISSGVGKIEREMAKIKPGDPVDLRLYYNGQYKNVKVVAGKASDRPHGARAISIMGSGAGFAGNLMALPMAGGLRVDGPAINDRVRRLLDEAGVAGAMGRGGFGAAFGGNRVRW